MSASRRGPVVWERRWWRGLVLLLPLLAAVGVLRAEATAPQPLGEGIGDRPASAFVVRSEPVGLGQLNIRTATPVPALAEPGRTAAGAPTAALRLPDHAPLLLVRTAPGRPAAPDRQRHGVGDRHRGRAPPGYPGAGIA